MPEKIGVQGWLQNILSSVLNNLTWVSPKPILGWTKYEAAAAESIHVLCTPDVALADDVYFPGKGKHKETPRKYVT